MHSSPCGTNEGALKVNANDLRGKLTRGRQSFGKDELRNISDAAAGFHFARGHRGGHHRSRAMGRNRCRNDLKRLGCALHYVATARAVDMDVHKARHNGFPPCRYFARATRRNDSPPLADSGDLAALNHDDGVGDFLEGGDGAVGVDCDRLHRCRTILLESRKNGHQRSYFRRVQEPCRGGQINESAFLIGNLLQG